MSFPIAAGRYGDWFVSNGQEGILSTPAILAEDLQKSFGETHALAGQREAAVAALAPMADEPPSVGYAFSCRHERRRGERQREYRDDDIWGAFVWSIVLAAVFGYLSVRRYRRAVST
jgi:hypothetical protein